MIESRKAWRGPISVERITENVRAGYTVTHWFMFTRNVELGYSSAPVWGWGIGRKWIIRAGELVAFAGWGFSARRIFVHWIYGRKPFEYWGKDVRREMVARGR